MLSAEEEKEFRQMLAERAIYKAMMRYCRGSDRADLELMKSAFHPDATNRHGMFDGKAYDFVELGAEIMKGKTEWSSGIKAQSHHITNFSVVFEDDKSANVESYFFYAFQHIKGETLLNAFFCARYLDHFTLRDEWRIERRKVVMDHYFEGPTDTFDKDLPASYIRGGLGEDDPIFAFLRGD